MVNPEDVRDALLERIAYHAISADANEVLMLAKAYDLLAGDGQPGEGPVDLPPRESLILPQAASH